MLNLARNETLQAGMAGRAGWACSVGNLRTLANSYQANFSRHLVLVLVPDLTRQIELPAVTRWEFPETLGNRCTDCSRGSRPRLQLQCAEWQHENGGHLSSSLPVDRIVTRKSRYLGT